MSQRVREEELPKLRARYGRLGREGRSRLIDEVCEQWGYSRKHAIKMLAGKAGWGGDPLLRKGRPPRYGPEVVKVLEAVWRSAEQPCGKRLKAMLGLWLPFYEEEQGPLPEQLREEVLSVSPAQIDRLLAPKKTGPKGLCGTRPGTLLKTQIPIRTDNWDINKPGFLEADTVAHCGESMAGDFIWSVTYTDIQSGWTATRAVWNRGAHGVVEATQQIEAELPFPLLGFDCDNGGEFLNHHLLRYFAERPRPVGFTRSRPYHKDDNGHVEQKNWSHVRQLLGYDRLEDPALLPLINRLYRLYWNPLHNYYMPSAKLIKKDREGAKIRRRHDIPQTPCQRLLDSPDIDERTKERLRRQRDKLNPFKLKKQIEKALRPILLRGLRCSRPTGSLHCAPEEAIP